MRGITPRRYRLDPTGASPNNKVVNEPRHIGIDRKVRVVLPRCGAFYTRSLMLYDAQTQQRLYEGQDYKCIHLDEENTKRFGQPIAYLIAITNPAVSPDVYFHLQAVGGMSSYLVPLLNQLIPMLETDERVLSWNNVINKPDGYNPGHHYHDVGDFYGFEYVVLVLMKISQKITALDIDNHVGIQAYISVVEQEFMSRWQAFLTDLNDHISNTNRPHQETPEQVGVYRMSQINQQLAGKLSKVGKAVNASKLFGFTKTQLFANIRQNYDGAALGDGSFPAQRMGDRYGADPGVAGTPGSTTVNTYREPSSGYAYNINSNAWMTLNGASASILWNSAYVAQNINPNVSSYTVGNATYYRGPWQNEVYVGDGYSGATYTYYSLYRQVTETIVVLPTPGYTPTQVLTNLVGWKDTSQVLSVANPVYVGESNLANVKAAFQNYPVGTRVNWIEVDYSYPSFSGMTRAFVSYHVIKNGSSYDAWAYC